MWLTLFQASVFILYVGFLFWWFKKPLPSISDSWYRLPSPNNYLFLAFCWILGFSTIFQSNFFTPLFFFAGAGLCFTGTAAEFRLKRSTTEKVHFIGAAVCIFFSLLGLGIERHFWWSFVAFVCLSGLVFLLNIKNEIWWAEIIAFGSILTGYIITSL